MALLLCAFVYRSYSIHIRNLTQHEVAHADAAGELVARQMEEILRYPLSPSTGDYTNWQMQAVADAIGSVEALLPSNSDEADNDTHIAFYRIRKEFQDLVEKSSDKEIAKALEKVVSTEEEETENEISYVSYRPAMAEAFFGSRHAHEGIYDAGDEYVISAYEPVHGENGRVLGIIAVNSAMGDEMATALHYVEGDVLFFAVGLGVTLFLVLFLLRSATKSLEALQEEAMNFAAGDFDAPITVNGPNEIKELAKVIDNARISIRQLFDQMQRVHQEREQMEKRIRQGQKLESIGTLAGGIAHDFNNMLGAIIGYAELLRMSGMDPEVSQRNAENILQVTSRAKTLVRQILAFSRKSEAKIELVNLQKIVDEALIIIQGAKSSRIRLEQEFDEDLATIMADPTQVYQVVMNLCTNAVHAMKADGGTLTVTVHNTWVDTPTTRVYPNMMVGPYVRLRVSDTGVGMDEQTLGRIFDPFFTTKAVDEGTGMGLSVVHGIVTQAGGDIHVYSEPSRGTTLHVYWPSNAETPGAQLEAMPGGTERILCVDDDEALNKAVGQMLALLGYQVAYQASGVEALEMIRANPMAFDLVISDFAMPLMTGLELARKVRKFRPDMAVILTSGFVQQIPEDALRALGLDAVLAKPVSATELARAVRSTLDSHAAKTG
ncbi:MAG: response regulator [Deltaproteobacteria bacterium]|nr:response regulator [Deltaproteobacteria bacterium]